MVKFGKTFRKSQRAEIADKYVDYKGLKQFIKRELKSEVKPKRLTTEFQELLNKEIKKIYIYFTKVERELYLEVNSYLHTTTNKEINLEYAQSEITELKKISTSVYEITTFIELNIVSLCKILKKFDKKFKDHLNFSFTNAFISDKLNYSKSDLFYIFKFKVLNDILALCEDRVVEASKLLGQIGSASVIQKKGNEQSQPMLATAPNEIKEKAMILSSIQLVLNKIEDSYKHIKSIYKKWISLFKISQSDKDEFSLIPNEDARISDSFKNDFAQKNIQSTDILSKENNHNVSVLYIHNFIYSMIWFSVLVDCCSITDKYYSKKSSDTNDYWYFFSSLFLIMFPLGDTVSALVPERFIKENFKVSLIISGFLAIIGNIAFGLAVKLDYFYLLFLSRFVLGIGCQSNLSKNYFSSFVPKRRFTKVMFRYKMISFIGYFSAPLICFILHMLVEYKEFNKEKIDTYLFVTSIIYTVLGLVITLLSFFMFSNPKGTGFNAYTNKGKGEMGSVFSLNKELSEKESEIFKQINEKVGEINQTSNYNDTNMLQKALDDIIQKNKNQCVILTFLLIGSFFSTVCFHGYLACTPFNLLYKWNFEFFKVSFFLFFALLIGTIAFFFNFLLGDKKNPFILLISMLILMIIFEALFIFLLETEGDSMWTVIIFVIIGLSVAIKNRIIYLFTKVIQYDYNPLCGISAGTLLRAVNQLGIFWGYLFVTLGHIENREDLSVRTLNHPLSITLMSWFTIILVFFICISRKFKDNAIRRLIREKNLKKYKRVDF